MVALGTLGKSTTIPLGSKHVSCTRSGVSRCQKSYRSDWPKSSWVATTETILECDSCKVLVEIQRHDKLQLDIFFFVARTDDLSIHTTVVSPECRQSRRPFSVVTTLPSRALRFRRNMLRLLLIKLRKNRVYRRNSRSRTSLQHHMQSVLPKHRRELIRSTNCECGDYGQ